MFRKKKKEIIPEPINQAVENIEEISEMPQQYVESVPIYPTETPTKKKEEVIENPVEEVESTQNNQDTENEEGLTEEKAIAHLKQLYAMLDAFGEEIRRIKYHLRLDF